MTKMRVRVLLALAAAAIFAVVPLVVAAGALGGPARCVPAHGLYDDDLVTPPPGLTTKGRVLGSLHGELNFALVSQTQSALNPSVGFFEAQSSIATDKGTIFIKETGASDGQNGNFTLLQTIVGGTGRYEGATGQLFAHGNFNFATGHGQGQYEGTICTQ